MKHSYEIKNGSNRTIHTKVISNSTDLPFVEVSYLLY